MVIDFFNYRSHRSHGSPRKEKRVVTREKFLDIMLNVQSKIVFHSIFPSKKWSSSFQTTQGVFHETTIFLENALISGSMVDLGSL